ncbi:Uncharacterised protein [Yersinia enterocolitica]|nr:Uncharacterised protein [Yersinia enterocolitica]
MGCPCSPMASVNARLLAAFGRNCKTSPWRAVIVSTLPKTIRSINSSQSRRSNSSSSSFGLHNKGAPTRRCANGIWRSPSTGTHNTRANLCRTWLLSQVMPLLPVRGATQTKVVSSGLPWALIGMVFSSIPISAKSCSGLLPALAPR